MIDYLPKRWIYSFYLTNDSFENEVNLLHLKLIKKYISLFDEVIFCIISDAGINEEVVKRLKYEISDSYNGILTFKHYSNTPMRESLVFHDEIVSKMESLNGYTFFGHNKGITNIWENGKNKESILEWVSALYYFNLSDIDTVINDFQAFRCCFWGALQSTVSDNWKINFRPQYDWYYMGTFFWGAYQHLLTTSNDYQSVLFKDRYFDEEFPGNCVDLQRAYTWNMCYGLQYNIDSNVDSCQNWIKCIYGENAYNKFKNSLCNNENT